MNHRLLAFGLGMLACASLPAQAAEPAREFLEALRDRGYYDMAIEYLDRMETSPLAPADLKTTLEYEKGTTLVAGAAQTRDVNLREKQLDQAYANLNSFIQKNPKHNLVAAANNQLGNLLVERARLRIERAERPSGAAQKPQLLTDARKMFDEAYGVFSKSKEDIAALLGPLNRTNLDPKTEADKIDLRDELRKQYLQAQLLAAAILEEKADTADKSSKEYKDLLTKAADEYKVIYEAYRTRLAGLYARLYQGRCHLKMGDPKEALSYFSDLLEQPDDPPPFRDLKTKTLLLAVDAWLSPSQKKTAEAVAKASEWLDKGRPAEATQPDWIELRFKLVDAIKQHMATLPANDKVRNDLQRQARTVATFLVRNTDGDRQRQAQQLLGSLGGSGNEGPQERPDPKDFAEARDFGKESLDRMQSADFVLKNVPPRIAQEKDAGIKAELEKQVEDAKKDIVEHRRAAIDMFNVALRMINDETPTDDINIVRYFLCYLNYAEGNYPEAAVIGEFLARRYPNAAGARPCAKIAMASYLKMFKDNPSDDKSFETKQVIGIADYITRRWADQPEAAEALNTLIPFMIREGDLQKAVDYIQQIPTDVAMRGEAELKTGQAMWGTYLRGKQDLRKQRSADTPTDPAALAAEEQRLDQLKTQAQKILADGVARMQAAGGVNPTVVTAVLSLAQIYVDVGQPELAVPVLEEPNIGALTLTVKKDPATSREGFAAETYKTALRAYIGSLPKAQDADLLMKKAKGVMAALKGAMGDTPDGQTKLVAIYVSLAQDLERQLDISDDEAKQALSQGFETFLSEVGKETTEFNVLNWVAETFFSLGKGFDEDTAQLSPIARGYYEKAVQFYDNMLARQKSNSSFIGDPQLVLQVKMRQAMTQRRLGKFQEAVDIFAEILREREQMLNVQVEAALTLQELGDRNRDADAYTRAIQGDIEGSGGKKIIWGWGRLSTTTARHPQFKDTFHAARYNLILSRYKRALLDSSAANKMKQVEIAKSEIRLTLKLFPDLGGAEQRQQYDTLLRNIQRELGNRTIGLAEFDEPAQTAAAN